MSDQEDIADLKARIESLERSRDDQNALFDAHLRLSFIFFERLLTLTGPREKIEEVIAKFQIDRETAAEPRFADIANAFCDHLRKGLSAKT
ncbi:hypothetical protein [Neotabrizicola sp. VNH66]|uniref:hypothetical protein n=1 Tax=Neotabrizicola sp. VNH66 TaxID=3400918 RepID=UPI003BFC5BB5